MNQPTLILTGLDGNAYSILVEARRAGLKFGWPLAFVEAIEKEAKAGDYDHLLQTMMKYFGVEYRGRILSK